MAGHANYVVTIPFSNVKAAAGDCGGDDDGGDCDDDCDAFTLCFFHLPLRLTRFMRSRRAGGPRCHCSTSLMTSRFPPKRELEENKKNGVLLFFFFGKPRRQQSFISSTDLTRQACSILAGKTNLLVPNDLRSGVSRTRRTSVSSCSSPPPPLR